MAFYKTTPISPHTKQWLYRSTIAFAILTIILAAILGMQKQQNQIEKQIQILIPPGTEYRLIKKDLFECYEAAKDLKVISYITTAKADGFSGPLEVAARIDTSGKIEQLIVISHKETQAFYDKVLNEHFLDRFREKSYADKFENHIDYNAVSGATYTSNGIAKATQIAVQKIAANQLHLEIPEIIPPSIKFGIPEIVLILLYLTVLLGLYTQGRIKKTIRWLTLITGMIVLGFWFTVPLSINKINQFILGYWPDWHTHLYWYMIIFSVFGLILIYRKRIYCQWFCPFGAAQECLALIGGGKVKIPQKLARIFTNLQRFMVWLAIVLALYYRIPSYLNYEIFSTFFALTGSSLLFVLMALFTVTAMFIKRPWCKILCPINALSDFAMYLRSWVTGIKVNGKTLNQNRK